MTELKRAVFSWRMVLAVFLVLLILMSPLYMDVTFRNNMWSYMAGYDILGSYYRSHGSVRIYSVCLHFSNDSLRYPVCGRIQFELYSFHTSAIGKNSLYLQ